MRQPIPIPWFIRWIAGVLQDSPQDPNLDASADMLLLFYAAGATILGFLLGCVLTLAHTSRGSASFRIAEVLAGTIVGGVCGLFLSLVLFRFREVMRWEKISKRGPR